MERQQGSKRTYHQTRAATNRQREEEARKVKRRERTRERNKKYRSNKSAKNRTPKRQRQTSEAVVTQRENIEVAVLGSDVVGRNGLGGVTAPGIDVVGQNGIGGVMDPVDEGVLDPVVGLDSAGNQEPVPLVGDPVGGQVPEEELQRTTTHLMMR